MSQAILNHNELLQRRVGEIRGRIRMLLAQQWLCVGLSFAALASLLLVAATRFRWWTDAIDYIWAFLLIGAITGLIIGWTRRITPLVAAQIADERAGLKERLSTAVELSAAERRSEIAEAQIEDAARHARELRPADVLPWRPPPQWRYVAASLAVLMGVIYLPELPFFQSPQERIDREVMRAEGQRIQKVAKEIQKRTAKKGGDENEKILRQIARNMQQLGKEQARGRISKKQALLKMNELKQQLKEAEQKTGQGQNAAARKSMDQVARSLEEAARRQSQQGNAEAARALQQMAEKLDKKDFEGAGRQLEELARKMQAGQMTPDEAQKASEMLEQMAQAMEGSGLEKASEEMKEAAKQLQQAAEKAKQLQQKMAQAKTDAERQELQRQMQQTMQQGAQQAASQCAKAGGT